LPTLIEDTSDILVCAVALVTSSAHEKAINGRHCVKWIEYYGIEKLPGR